MRVQHNQEGSQPRVYAKGHPSFENLAIIYGRGGLNKQAYNLVINSLQLSLLGAQMHAPVNCALPVYHRPSELRRTGIRQHDN